jgi:glycosyltransferase involved in cell wall biosynthesis
MRIVIDAIPVRYGGFAVALERLLASWTDLGHDDELHVAVAEDVELTVPEWVNVHSFVIGRPAMLRQIYVQSSAIRRLCRDTRADALLGILPTTTIAPLPCPKVIMVYDMRHELLPNQFGRLRRMMRKVAYAIGYRQSSGIICISERTRNDLLRLHPGLVSKPVFVVVWGADHTDTWPRRRVEQPYALAFGHFVNKGVERVVDAWRILADRGEAWPLVIVGIPAKSRARVTERIQAAGLSDLITPLAWQPPTHFQQRFASAGMIVFPSDFEGFGLPAVEALRLRIPLVISPDPALLEVTGGHAAVMEGWDAGALADAVRRAAAIHPEELDRASAWVEPFTWSKMAAQTRAALADVIAARQGAGSAHR